MPEPVKRTTQQQKKFTFRLKAGRHVGEKPNKTLHMPGDLIHTDTDLIAKHGNEKFELVRGPKDAAKSRAVVDASSQSFPGGQVHDGKQETKGEDEEGRTISGPMMGAETKDGGTKEVPEKSGDEAGGEETSETDDTEGEEEGDDEAPDFNSMSVKDLREYAADKEIDLSGCNTKAQIVQRMSGK